MLDPVDQRISNYLKICAKGELDFLRYYFSCGNKNTVNEEKKNSRKQSIDPDELLDSFNKQINRMNSRE